MITWTTTTTGKDIKPYQQGSLLDITTLGPLTEAIKLRLESDTLRSNGEEVSIEGQSIKYKGYKIVAMDSTTPSSLILMERFYGSYDVYFYVGNFGEVRSEIDWSKLLESGIVEVESSGGDTGPLDLTKFRLEDGHSMLIAVPRWMKIRDGSVDDRWS